LLFIIVFKVIKKSLKQGALPNKIWFTLEIYFRIIYDFSAFKKNRGLKFYSIIDNNIKHPAQSKIFSGKENLDI